MLNTEHTMEVDWEFRCVVRNVLLVEYADVLSVVGLNELSNYT